MRLTVTGGAGYIGSVVAEVLLRDDLDVHAIDNLVKGRRAATDAALFEAIDLTHRCAVASSLGDFGSQAVIDMAAYSLVGRVGRKSARRLRQQSHYGAAVASAHADAPVKATGVCPADRGERLDGTRQIR